MIGNSQRALLRAIGALALAILCWLAGWYLSHAPMAVLQALSYGMIWVAAVTFVVSVLARTRPPR